MLGELAKAADLLRVPHQAEIPADTELAEPLELSIERLQKVFPEHPTEYPVFIATLRQAAVAESLCSAEVALNGLSQALLNMSMEDGAVARNSEEQVNKRVLIEDARRAIEGLLLQLEDSRDCCRWAADTSDSSSAKRSAVLKRAAADVKQMLNTVKEQSTHGDCEILTLEVSETEAISIADSGSGGTEAPEGNTIAPSF